MVTPLKRVGVIYLFQQSNADDKACLQHNSAFDIKSVTGRVLIGVRSQLFEERVCCVSLRNKSESMCSVAVLGVNSGRCHRVSFNRSPVTAPKKGGAPMWPLLSM